MSHPHREFNEEHVLRGYLSRPKISLARNETHLPMRKLGRQIWRLGLAWKGRVLVVYLCLLFISFVIRSQAPREPIPSDVQVMSVPAIRGEQTTNHAVRLAFREYVCENSREGPVVVLLHGSPGNHRDFYKLAPELARQFRVIVADLPGFGSLSHSIPDYSTRADARYVLELLDQLQVPRAHFIGFSMGGGVVLNIADIAPERVESIVMLSAIGVQEMELLGDYYINHSLHGLQLAGLWLMREGLPHFGWLDHSMLDVSYARTGPDQQAALTTEFLDRVERGQAVVRATADAQRVVAAAAPFNPAASIPRAMGPTALVVFAL